MKVKRFEPFFGPDEEGGGGSAVDFFPPVGQEPTDDGGDVADDPGDEGVPPATAQPTATVDAAEFARQFGGVIAEQFKTVAPKQEEKKLTPEEARKLLNVMEFNDEFITKFGNMETQKAAFESLRDGIINQANTIMQIRLKEMQEQFAQQFTPIQQMLQERQVEERMSRFDSRFPQLSNPALRPLLSAVGNEVVRTGKKFASETEAFDHLAAEVEKVIQTTNPAFKLAPTQKGAVRQAGKVPVTSRGSSGASGGGGDDGAAPGVPKAVSLLPKVR